MQKKTIAALAGAFFWGGLFFLIPLVQAGNVGSSFPVFPDRKVLVVHSYHENQQGHVVEMNQGIDAAFVNSGVKMEYVYMDTKRNNDLAWKIQAGRMATRKMEAFDPDVVIAMDDNAQTFFVAKNCTRKQGPVFVFGGVNADISTYGFPRENVTGVLERPNVVESIELLQKIVPRVKKMLMLSDKSETTDYFIAYCKTLALPVEVIAYEQPLTLEDWKASVMKYRDMADAVGVYVSRTVKAEPSGKRLVPEAQLMEILTREGGLPTVGFFDTAASAGVLCGISVSMREQGYAAGRMARSILEGKKPGEFTIAPTRGGRIQLNLKTAEKLGIDIAYKIISKADVVVK
ncbi:MAG: hypothetical protein KKC20_01815 [Proteobacteria bacterium]|nr:hypothetical protein [Pseudomonadota bacterium]